MSRDLCLRFREKVVYFGASSPRGLGQRMCGCFLRVVGDIGGAIAVALSFWKLEKTVVFLKGRRLRDVVSMNFPPSIILCIHGEESGVTSVTTLQCLESAAARSAPGRSAPCSPLCDAPENVRRVQREVGMIFRVVKYPSILLLDCQSFEFYHKRE